MIKDFNNMQSILPPISNFHYHMHQRACSTQSNIPHHHLISLVVYHHTIDFFSFISQITSRPFSENTMFTKSRHSHNVVMLFMISFFQLLTKFRSRLSDTGYYSYIRNVTWWFCPYTVTPIHTPVVRNLWFMNRTYIPEKMQISFHISCWSPYKSNYVPVIEFMSAKPKYIANLSPSVLIDYCGIYTMGIWFPIPHPKKNCIFLRIPKKKRWGLLRIWYRERGRQRSDRYD